MAKPEPKTATITVEEAGGSGPPAEDRAPAVVKAKAAAIKDLAGETKALRKDAYSNDNWRIRRRVVFIALGFIAVNVEYLIVFAQDDALRQNIAIGLISAAVAIIGSYVFGAVWDDTNKRNTLQEAVSVVEAG